MIEVKLFFVLTKKKAFENNFFFFFLNAKQWNMESLILLLTKSFSIGLGPWISSRGKASSEQDQDPELLFQFEFQGRKLAEVG